MSDWCPENDGAYRAEMAAMYPVSNRKRIEELESQLREIALDANAALGQAADAYEAQLKAEAALPRAYQMGLDAAANVRVQGTVGMVGLTDRVADAIRALTPPADLAERAKGTDHE